MSFTKEEKINSLLKMPSERNTKFLIWSKINKTWEVYNTDPYQRISQIFSVDKHTTG